MSGTTGEATEATGKAIREAIGEAIGEAIREAIGATGETTAGNESSGGKTAVRRERGVGEATVPETATGGGVGMRGEEARGCGSAGGGGED